MDEISGQGEFHHFQLFTPGNGSVPMSISILIHAATAQENQLDLEEEPLTGEDVLALHWELEHFDGDFRKAFAKARKQAASS
jgi:hypothetical protein